MGDYDHLNKEPGVPKGKIVGAYKQKVVAMGPTTDFQDNWFIELPADGQPHRERWHVHQGARNEDSQLMAGCSFCNETFQCRAQTLKSHENSSNHQKEGTAWILKQKDRAGSQEHCLQSSSIYSISAHRPDSGAAWSEVAAKCWQGQETVQISHAKQFTQER
eukprot:scaffold14348_cov19-Tisochrysis_lutea.AAC.2